MSEEQCNRCGNMAHFISGGNPEVSESTETLVIPTDDWGKLFWAYNLPLQMWPNDDNTFGVVDYMARKESITRISKTVTPEELPQFCKNTSVVLRNLADRFEMLGRGEIDSIYYADEGLEV